MKMSSSIVPLRKHPSGRAPSLELPQWWVLKNSSYGITGDAQGAISSTKGQHVTRITCCDYRHTYVTTDTLM
jgi:hypothetical protein